MSKPPSSKSKQVAKRPSKLPSGASARAVPEWIGKSPDSWPPPVTVRARIVLRQQGKCAISGMKFGPKAKPRFDHVKPLADGGLNRESNVQAILDQPHKVKTKAEAKVRKRVQKRAKTHLGIKDPPDRPLVSRNDLPASPRPKKVIQPVPGVPALMRQGWVSALDVKGKGRRG